MVVIPAHCCKARMAVTPAVKPVSIVSQHPNDRALLERGSEGGFHCLEDQQRHYFATPGRQSVYGPHETEPFLCTIDDFFDSPFFVGLIRTLELR
jgi:hypothetical protein